MTSLAGSLIVSFTTLVVAPDAARAGAQSLVPGSSHAGAMAMTSTPSTRATFAVQPPAGAQPPANVQPPARSPAPAEPSTTMPPAPSQTTGTNERSADPASGGASSPAPDPTQPPAATSDGATIGDPFREREQTADAGPRVDPAAAPPAYQPNDANDANEGVGAVGGRGYVPLPPPPEAKPVASIRRAPWRGRFWLQPRLGFNAPLAGRRPAAGTIISVEAGAAFGWRIYNVIGLYAGFSSYIHDGRRIRGYRGDDSWYVIDFGRIFAIDAIGLRLYAPVSNRFQPFFDVAGGPVAYTPAFDDDSEWGTQFRIGVGFDGWITPNFTMGATAMYRLVTLRDEVGHNLQLLGQMGFHW